MYSKYRLKEHIYIYYFILLLYTFPVTSLNFEKFDWTRLEVLKD